MKRPVSILSIVFLILFLLTSNAIVNSLNVRQLDSSPNLEYFEKVSLKYYGTTSFAVCLAVINQSVTSPEELTRHDIIVPSRDALVVIHQTCDFSAMADVLRDQQSDGAIALLVN